MVTDAKLVEFVFQAIRDGEVLKVSQELASLCASAKIGEKLFATYAPSIVGARMAQYIQAKLDSLPAKLTPTAWHLAVRECLEEGESNRAGQHLFKKRDVVVKYRDAQVSVSVSSFWRGGPGTHCSMVEDEGYRLRRPPGDVDGEGFVPCGRRRRV